MSVRALLLLPLLAFASPASADERTVMVTGFDRVRVDGPFTVRVTTGGSPRVRITGDGAAIEKVSVRSESGVLVVAPTVNAWGERPTATRLLPEVVVVTPSLRSANLRGSGTLTVDRMAGQRVEIAVSGAGAVTVETIQAERLDVALYGTGVLTLGGRARDARFTANGPGTVAAEALDAARLQVNAQGLGGAAFTARETAAISAIGTGAITVVGAPSCTVSGSAPVTCGRAR